MQFRQIRVFYHSIARSDYTDEKVVKWFIKKLVMIRWYSVGEGAVRF